MENVNKGLYSAKSVRFQIPEEDSIILPDRQNYKHLFEFMEKGPGLDKTIKKFTETLPPEKKLLSESQVQKQKQKNSPRGGRHAKEQSRADADRRFQRGRRQKYQERHQSDAVQAEIGRSHAARLKNEGRSQNLQQQAQKALREDAPLRGADQQHPSENAAEGARPICQVSDAGAVSAENAARGAGVVEAIVRG